VTGRRIIICNDGTWNTPDDRDRDKRKPTNITKISRGINSVASDGVSQLVYYDEGVGTGFAEKIIGGATGFGISKNIVEAYRFICNNYREGDELFLFGFSRGAFTSRSLIGFLAKVGVVASEDSFYIPELFQFYRGQHSDAEVTEFYNRKSLTRRQPKVKMIGVFDTVGALGLPIGGINKVLERANIAEIEFHDVELHPFVENAYHALAIDERRKPFAPSLWSNKPSATKKMEQRWFAGVHSNIGGGYDPDGLANIALHYIVDNATHCGLEFNKEFLANYEPHYNSELRNSMSFKYRLMGPLERKISPGGPSNEVIDDMVKMRREDPKLDYDPKNAVIT